MSLASFLIFSLATWRLASLLTGEDGPFLMFRKLRERVGIEHDDDGNVYAVPDTFLAGVLSCVWCCSIWVALGWILYWLLLPNLAELCAIPFAISAGAIVVERLANKA